MKVVDLNGNVVYGLVRTEGYGLSVNDTAAYTKYIKEKERIEDIQRLKNDVQEMKATLSEILKAIHGKHTL